MAAGDTLQGRRLPDGSPIAALEKPGDYLRTGGVILWAVLPDGTCARLDERWTILEEGDGTLTVDPSIWDRKPHGWHGYLEQGVWREV